MHRADRVLNGFYVRHSDFPNAALTESSTDHGLSVALFGNASVILTRFWTLTSLQLPKMRPQHGPLVPFA